MIKPIISIVMGSDSDLSVMNDAVQMLEEFDIPHEILILSAHRTPEETRTYAMNAVKKGIKVIIAGAGGAAHLAGVIAAYFSFPVIGVPIRSSSLNGLDSLYSIVQMPPGVPVATVGLNAAKNAGLLAIEILAIENKFLQKKLADYKLKQTKNVINKNTKLHHIGVKQYLELINVKNQKG
jgi:5-(carboxyamino)imidazole ribonucleotide mutase